MAPKVREIMIIWFVFMHPVITEINMISDIRISKSNSDCTTVRPPPKLIARRFQSLLPFLDVNQVNPKYFQDFQSIILTMFEENNLLDREAAFYAVILTPLIFLHKYKDSWCLIEKFHEALQSYQRLSADEKRKYLKLLKNTRVMGKKVRDFIFSLPVNPNENVITEEFMEGEIEMEVTAPSPAEDTIAQIGTTSLLKRKKLLRNFIMQDTIEDTTYPEGQERQEKFKFVKQLIKSLG